MFENQVGKPALNPGQLCDPDQDRPDQARVQRDEESDEQGIEEHAADHGQAIQPTTSINKSHHADRHDDRQSGRITGAEPGGNGTENTSKIHSASRLGSNNQGTCHDSLHLVISVMTEITKCARFDDVAR